jgi:GGDEF domain-containing protein
VSQRPDVVSHLALDWLREILHTEFDGSSEFQRTRGGALVASSEGSASTRPLASHASDDPFDVRLRYSSGDVGSAQWYRDWHRGWRRYQLADRLQRYAERLLGAKRPEEVYRALTEHAVQVVGGYTSVLFPPQAAMPLRPLPNPKLTFDAGRLALSIPLPLPGTLRRDDVLAGGPLVSLSPLFTEANAVTVACAPFSDGGLILLLERRHERVFSDDDREMLRLLAELAGAALARVRVAARTETLIEADERTGVLSENLLQNVLDHAITLAGQREPLTLVALRLTGLERVRDEDGPTSVDRTIQTAASALRELAGTLGIVLERGADGFFLVLPRLTRPQAMGLVERLRRQLPLRVGVLAGAAEHGDSCPTPAALAAAASEDPDSFGAAESVPPTRPVAAIATSRPPVQARYAGRSAWSLP